MEHMIYLDNAATTYPKPESVYVALDNANRNLAINSGRGSYRIARETTKLIDETKSKIMNLVNAPSGSCVVFTPSITIALNEILNGITWSHGCNVYVSPFEHNAVARTINLIAKRQNINVIELPVVNETLEIDLENMKYMFSKNQPICVCCTHISNVTGYILPVEKIFETAKQYCAITILDTAQSMGLIEIDSKKMNADFIAFAGHKSLYGPFGIGGFIDIGNIPLNEFIVGGTGSDSLNLDMPSRLPDRYESSSPNIVAIAGLKAALEEYNPSDIFAHEKELTKYLVERLSDIEDVILYIPPEDKHIGVVSFNLKDYKAEDLGMILDADFDIAVRTGYHCAPYIHKLLKDDGNTGTVRVGLGRFNTSEDVDALITAIEELNE